MDSFYIATSASGLVRRLADTVPMSSPSSPGAVVEDLVAYSRILTSSQCLHDLLILTIVVVLALELLTKLVYYLPGMIRGLLRRGGGGGESTSIPVRGKHLDNFSWKDRTFIGINKCMTGLFVYCYFGYLWSVRRGEAGHYGGDHHHDDHRSHLEEESLGGGSGGQHHTHHRDCCGGGSGIWSTSELSLANTLLPLPLLFVTYDFFYTLLHWLLHVKGIYAYVHKHHHHQKAPSRANTDAVNVHPLEFFLGEFNHVLALRLVVRGMPTIVGFHGTDVSWVGATLFIALGGILAGLNHTRHDVVARVPRLVPPLLTGSSSCGVGGSEVDTNGTSVGVGGGGWTVFDSKHHDVHHRIPQSNYGQYTVFWDRIFGTFREYDENDRVNPAYQLDPATGKTIISRKEQLGYKKNDR
eukprot:CAMPEP_0181078922 /NCGR_PEP_ID=MMETSP1071-20121207/1748_1 /TAXON_ID=35127 /ORGANISM="Thalassiosira sp., Strain NH16" /LENGTH=410 /DNA_ID=CAMNT_0023160277 /DNA_START=1 /DNA_END=1231 /DNA_ORIENTATION=-